MRVLSWAGRTPVSRLALLLTLALIPFLIFWSLWLESGISGLFHYTGFCTRYLWIWGVQVVLVEMIVLLIWLFLAALSWGMNRIVGHDLSELTLLDELREGIWPRLLGVGLWILLWIYLISGPDSLCAAGGWGAGLVN